VIRIGGLTFALLGLSLLTFGVVADRALVEQGELARQAAVTAANEVAALTASSVRAALGAIEGAVLEGRPAEGARVETLAIPPEPSAQSLAAAPYSRRPRAELSALLRSAEATPSGLPEAVVARIALGETGRLSSEEEAAPDVGAKLLGGELPVRPEDLPYLARVLGVFDAERVRALAERLRNAPDPARVPVAPAFRRALSSAQEVEGWTRVGRLRRRYRVSAETLLWRAGVAGRARLRRGSVSPREMTVPIADVEGFDLAVAPDTSRELRVRLLRLLLWVAVATSVVGLWTMRRAIVREARATAREKAFLAGVTHELRSPLASIRLLAETLAEGRGDPREYGSLVAGESERLEGLVERVLSLARVDAAPTFGPVEPDTLVRATLALLAPRAERRSVALESRVEPLPTAHWDAEAVRSALANLVDNAIVHGREGGRVVVRAQAAGEEVRIGVSDDGPGIGRRERRSVFGRFVRGRSPAPGSGLGLYLVEQVARAHGGRVDLETEEGRGSTFTLVLPLRPPSAPESEA